MSKRERKQMAIRNARRAKAKRILAAGCLVFIVTCGILFSSIFTDAHGEEQDKSYKYFKSIEVSAGDSLWDLAGTYMSIEYASRKDYIKEVMDINHMASSTIYDGQALIVPYYDETFC